MLNQARPRFPCRPFLTGYKKQGPSLVQGSSLVYSRRQARQFVIAVRGQQRFADLGRAWYDLAMRPMGEMGSILSQCIGIGEPGPKARPRRPCRATTLGNSDEQE